MENFQQVLQKYTDQFEADKTFTLILRLHHNVIKTAIRRISLAYSRISLDDVAKKLRLESPADAEFIIAKVYIPCPLLELKFKPVRRYRGFPCVRVTSRKWNQSYDAGFEHGFHGLSHRASGFALTASSKIHFNGTT